MASLFLLSSLIGVAVGFPTVVEFDCSSQQGVIWWGCRAYGLCQGGRYSQVDCVNGTVYHRQSRQCADQSPNVPYPCGKRDPDCSRFAQSPGHRTPDTDQDTFENRPPCSYYYTCAYGFFLGYQACNEGTVYDEEEQRCSPIEQVPPPCGRGPVRPKNARIGAPSNQYGNQNQIGNPTSRPNNQFGGQTQGNQFGQNPNNQFGQTTSQFGTNQYGNQNPQNPRGPQGSQTSSPQYGGQTQFGGQNPTQNPQFGGQTQNPQYGGQTQNPQNGGQTQNPQYGGQTQNPQYGGQTQNPQYGGQTQNPQYGGQTQNPQYGGQTQNPQFGGQTQNPQFGGQTQNPRFGGQTQNPQFGGQTQNPQFGGQTQNPQFGGQFGGSTQNPNQSRQPITQNPSQGQNPNQIGGPSNNNNQRGPANNPNDPWTGMNMNKNPNDPWPGNQPTNANNQCTCPCPTASNRQTPGWR